MKKIVTLALTTALLTSATPIAFAQTGVSTDLNANAGVSAGTSSDGTNAGVNAGVGVGAGAAVGTNTDGTTTGSVQTMASLSSKADIQAAIDHVKAASDVNIVTWSSVNGTDSADLQVFEQIDAAMQATANGAVNASSDAAASASTSATGDAAVKLDPADPSYKAELKSMIEANATLVAALKDKGYTPDQVIAITSEANGMVKIYVDDRS